MLCFEVNFEVAKVVVALLAYAVPDAECGGVGEILVEDPVCVGGEGCAAVLANGAAIGW